MPERWSPVQPSTRAVQAAKDAARNNPFQHPSTIRVRRRSDGLIVIINLSDYDPDVYDVVDLMGVPPETNLLKDLRGVSLIPETEGAAAEAAEATEAAEAAKVAEDPPEDFVVAETSTPVVTESSGAPRAITAAVRRKALVLMRKRCAETPDATRHWRGELCAAVEALVGHPVARRWWAELKRDARLPPSKHSH